MLSPDELARAGRFYFAHDQERFILARAALRRLLAGRLGLAPSDVRFVYSRSGKPALVPEQAGDPPLRFNLSHSQVLAFVALASGLDVGVDVEFHRALPDLLDLARRFFSPRESARLLSLPAADQAAAFFRCWTRKEAILKARGDGLAGGLDRFDVSFEAERPAALLQVLDDPAEAARWALFDMSPAPSCAAAVAIRDCRAHLSGVHTFSDW